jgi:hypothetical protein
MAEFADAVDQATPSTRPSGAFLIVLRSTPRLVAISLCERPAYQWTKISVTSVTSNVLLAKLTPGPRAIPTVSARALAPVPGRVPGWPDATLAGFVRLTIVSAVPATPGCAGGPEAAPSRRTPATTRAKLSSRLKIR